VVDCLRLDRNLLAAWKRPLFAARRFTTGVAHAEVEAVGHATATAPTKADDPGLESIEQLCEMALRELGARRVLVWRHTPSSRLVSPIAAAVATEPAFSLSNLVWRWSDTSVEDISPFEQSLRESGPVIATADELHRQAPAFARELIAESVWCEPVVVGQPVAILTIEPAPADSAAEIVRRIGTSIGALLTWEAAERGRTQAELLLALIEAAGAHTGSLGELLAMICRQLASQIGVTRASVFMASDGRLVPRMSSYADGHADAEEWERFRAATEPLAIVDAAFASQRPVVAVNSHNSAISAWWADQFGVQAGVGVPLGRADSAIGVLLLESKIPRTFRHDDVRVVAAAGTLLGEIIQRAQEAEQRETRLAAGDSLRELLKLGLESPDIAHMASRLAVIARHAMECEVAVVCLPDGAGELHELERAAASKPRGPVAPAHTGPLTLPAELSAPLAVNDVKGDRRELAELVRELGLASGVVIPLAAHGAGRGILVCGNTTATTRGQRRLELAGQLGLESGLVLEATWLREVDRARRAELQVQAGEARRSAEVKAAFLANMSHEIRTPMNGVLGMNELLLETELSGEQREYADQVARAGEHMMTIIDEILDISKIEAGQLELDASYFDLREAIRDACAIAGLLAETKGLRFAVQFDDDVPEQAFGDRRRLRQILLNLVSNAVKFTTAGEVNVNVSLESRAGGERMIGVRVADTGIGVNPDALDRLFEPFTQADASTTRSYGGTGLGLSIARELVRLMGGEISATRNPNGSGSTFSFDFPLLAPGARGDSAPALAQAGAAPDPLWSTAPLVLVVEDNPVNQIVAVAALKRCGCRTEVASDGRRALESLSASRYDAVLMDCQMPGMDGYEATRELRRRENGDRRTPVIAMTAHAMDGDRDKCLAAGMDDYVTKPVRRQLLAATLQRWIPASDGR
jgi:signal transduction histidine kinase/ActR/RegA family two-component response regulator